MMIWLIFQTKFLIIQIITSDISLSFQNYEQEAKQEFYLPQLVGFWCWISPEFCHQDPYNVHQKYEIELWEK